MTTCPRTAIILAAGEVPGAIRAFVGSGPAALLPINGRPIIQWSLDYLHDQGVERVVVGVRDGHERLSQFLNQVFGSKLDIDVVTPDDDRGPGFTLLECLDRLTDGEPVLVVLGDTLFRFPAASTEHPGQSLVLTASVDDASRWCLADVAPDGTVLALADKPTANPDSWPALIGVYLFDSPSLAVEALRDLADGEGSLELRHALEPYVRAGRLRAQPAEDWFDCGNPDNLATSRRRLLPARSFNTVEVDEFRGTLTKRSGDGPTLLDEIDYYRDLPADLRIFFPRLVDQDRAPTEPWLTIEYYGYSTLSEVWAFVDNGPRRWERIFSTLARILGCFAEHRAPLSHTAIEDVYWDKTLERLDALSRQRTDLKDLVAARELRLNGSLILGWRELAPEIEARVRGLAAGLNGCVIHGDLCFPNILYDPLSGLIKFIDPRGRFGHAGVHGDPRYDRAKILQSIDGGYDQFIHGLFRVDRSGLDLTVRQHFPHDRAPVLDAYRTAFAGGADLDEIRLIQGLLFLSMCPLHSEDVSRQVGMFATGLRILNEVLAR